MNWKVKAVIALAKQIKPGWRANALAACLRMPCKIFQPRADVARKNIDIIFPELSGTEKKKILMESYDNMILTGIETLAQQSDPLIRESWVYEAVGKEYCEEAFAKGKGIIGLSAHIGNWELAASILAMHLPVTAIVRQSDNAFYRELVEYMRVSAGLKTLDKREPMIRGASALRRNEIFGIMPDQFGGADGIKVPFFGVETSTLPGAAIFAYLTGAPIIPIQMIRLEPFKFKMIIDPPIKWEKLADRESTIRDITIKANKCIEKMILRAPGQWLWQHRRFREQPY